MKALFALPMLLLLIGSEAVAMAGPKTMFCMRMLMANRSLLPYRKTMLECGSGLLMQITRRPTPTRHFSMRVSF